jgi:hypothetical protein
MVAGKYKSELKVPFVMRFLVKDVLDYTGDLKKSKKCPENQRSPAVLSHQW